MHSASEYRLSGFILIAKPRWQIQKEERVSIEYSLVSKQKGLTRNYASDSFYCLAVKKFEGS